MTRSLVPIPRPRLLTELVAEEIRRRILRGDFPPGAALPEKTLAAELGVSKTPVREALLRLGREGLVTVRPQRGTFVFDMTAPEIRELGELRELLETGALRLAMARNRDGLARDLGRIVTSMREVLARGDTVAYRHLDTEYHLALFLHAGNRFLLRAYEGVAFRIQALLVRLSAEPPLNDASLSEHADIAEGVARGDTEAVVGQLVRHIRTTTRNYVERLEARPPAPPAEDAPSGARRAGRRKRRQGVRSR